jgi:hypothetical protein
MSELPSVAPEPRRDGEPPLWEVRQDYTVDARGIVVCEGDEEMTATGHYNGNPIEYVDGAWRYLDGEIADTSRPCPRCGRLPTPEGHDACLGHLPGVSSACCGHGIKPGYVRYTNGTEVRYSGEDGTWAVCSDGRPIAWFVDEKMAKEYAKPAPEDETRTYNCGGLPVDLTLQRGEHDLKH